MKSFFNMLMQSLLIVLIGLCVWTAIQIISTDTTNNILKILQ